jgi:hypothetical protein
LVVPTSTRRTPARSITAALAAREGLQREQHGGRTVVHRDGGLAADQAHHEIADAVVALVALAGPALDLERPVTRRGLRHALRRERVNGRASEARVEHDTGRVHDAHPAGPRFAQQRLFEFALRTAVRDEALELGPAPLVRREARAQCFDHSLREACEHRSGHAAPLRRVASVRREALDRRQQAERIRRRSVGVHGRARACDGIDGASRIRRDRPYALVQWTRAHAPGNACGGAPR